MSGQVLLGGLFGTSSLPRMLKFVDEMLLELFLYFHLWMSIFHIILHQNTNSLEAGLMNPQLVLCALTLTKRSPRTLKNFNLVLMVSCRDLAQAKNSFTSAECSSTVAEILDGSPL
jgi:hypothetical protein